MSRRRQQVEPDKRAAPQIDSETIETEYKLQVKFENKSKNTHTRTQREDNRKSVKSSNNRSNNYVSAKFLRVDLPALQRDRLSGGSRGAAQGFHILSFRLLQVRPLRHQADAQDIFQQSTQAGRQRGERAHKKTKDLGDKRAAS